MVPSGIHLPTRGFSHMTITRSIPTIDDLRERRAEILAIAAKHGASNVRVFGSVAHADATPESDVDFLVDLEPSRTILDLADLLMDLQDICDREVNLLTEPALHWYIRERVLQSAILLRTRRMIASISPTFSNPSSASGRIRAMTGQRFLRHRSSKTPCCAIRKRWQSPRNDYGMRRKRGIPK